MKGKEMSKNYYPEMMDEIAKKDISQQEILDYFYRHEPHSVIEAVQAVRKAKLHPSKAEIDRFMARYSPDVPVKAEPEKPAPIKDGIYTPKVGKALAIELKKIKDEKGRIEAVKHCQEASGYSLQSSLEIVDAL